MEHMLTALQIIFTPEGLLTLLIGFIIGMSVGILPALGQGTALILAMPFAFYMDPSLAFLLFAALLGSSTEGGSVTSILLNTPGTVGNLTTMFDGFPMARKGEAARALGIAGASSLSGGTFGIVILILIIPLVKPLMYLFGAPEYFWSVVVSLVIISLATTGSAVFKGLIAGAFGILLSLIGFNKVTGLTRYVGDTLYLWDGFGIVVLVVGLFALSELVMLQAEGKTIQAASETKAGHGHFRQSIKGAIEAWRSWPKLFNGSIIGTIIGIVPGIGSETATYMSYSTAKMLSKNKESFGKGNPIGIMVSESSSNAKDGGSLIPTLFLGIPGSPEMAILLGAFIIFGLQPGPGMALEHLDLLWTIIFSITISSTAAGFLVILGAPLLCRITKISISMVVAVAVPLSLSAVYATRNNAWDFIFLALFAGVGILLKRGGYPLQSLIIGYVLGPLAEKAFFTTLQSNYYKLIGFFHSFLSISLAAAIGILMLGLMIKNVWRLARSPQKSSDLQDLKMKKDPSEGQHRGSAYASITSSVFLIAVALLFLAFVPTMEHPGSLFPLLFGGLIVLLGAIVLSSDISPKFGRIIEPVLGAYLRKGEQRLSVETKKIVPIFGWVFVLIGFTMFFGSLLGNFIFTLGILRIWGRRRWLNATIFAIIVSMGIYIVFDVLFEIPFWNGFAPEIIPNLLGGEDLPPF
jgi:putative tricarboxylic transport membrane protein